MTSFGLSWRLQDPRTKEGKERPSIRAEVKGWDQKGPFPRLRKGLIWRWALEKGPNFLARRKMSEESAGKLTELRGGAENELPSFVSFSFSCRPPPARRPSPVARRRPPPSPLTMTAAAAALSFVRSSKKGRETKEAKTRAEVNFYS